MKIHVDLGVNRAFYARRYINDYDLCYGFEPLPRYADDLRNLESKDKRFIFIPCAAWNENGEAILYPSGDEGHGSTMMNNKQRVIYTNDNGIKVTTIDFDAWIKQTLSKDNINDLRLDIEGAEYVVLPHIIANQSIEYFQSIVWEVHRWKFRDDIFATQHEQVMKWFETSNIQMTIETKQKQKQPA